jgi:hypothetical protein
VNRILERVQDLQVTVSPEVIQQIVVEGSAKADLFGARPMRRAAQRYIEDSLSDALIHGFVSAGDGVTLKLGEPTAAGKQVILVTRSGDDKSFPVEVEDASGGIDGASEKSSSQQQPPASTGMLSTQQVINS